MSQNKMSTSNGTSIVIRGGRMTKWKGQTASYAPNVGLALGGVSGTALAVGLAMAGIALTPGSAQAGTCAETVLGSGVWVCSGPAGADAPQNTTGAGNVTVTTVPGFGINAAGTGISVFANGTLIFTDSNASAITGSSIGITALNFGTGATTVTSSGTVTGTSSYGIRADNGTNSTDLTITANNTSGGNSGILAVHSGTGALAITSTGTATGTTGYGIRGFNLNGTNLAITANNTSGRFAGISGINSGTGSLTITSTGTATGTNYWGIRGYNGTRGTDLTITANDTSGGRDGINAYNRGSGALTITSTGTATGTNNYSAGIRAYNGTSGTDLTITANTTSGANNGIDATNRGTGALTITSTGTATATNSYGSGIRAYNNYRGTDLTITANTTSGAINGIYARNRGSGALTITSTGTATATNSNGLGIRAYNSTSGTDLTITANTTSGASNGIDATNRGSGALTITSTGTATGTNNYSAGIRAYNGTSGTDLTITANTTSGGRYGINTYNRGSGALTITSTGTATGTASYGSGIRAYNSFYGTDLTITANTTSGGRNGINANNRGSGALTITSTGTATATNSYGSGIRAYNSYSGTDLTITANTTSGARYGIYARNRGSGALTITSTGTATGTDNYGSGIRAYNSYNGTNLTITANTTSGGRYGINAYNRGSGALTITSTGTATATNSYGSGINANNSYYGTDLTVTANTTSGGSYGINAYNRGSGALTITSTGTATGTNSSGSGIRATNSANGTDLTITANTTSGGRYGINAYNRGSGALTITSTGTATGTNGYSSGISASNSSNGTDLTITANTTSGGRYGINAYNRGSGALTITSTGTATGTNGYSSGIRATNSYNGTDLTITANTTSGGRYGISANNRGSGALTITSTGTATGTYGDGILAYNSYNGTTLNVTANNVTGGINGIRTISNGSGATTVTLTGTAQGGSGAAIDSSTLSGSLTTINIAATGRALAGSSGVAIRNNGGNSVLNVASGGVINGEVRLGDGSDVVNLAGANVLSGITVLDGGDDTLAADGMIDQLNLNGVSGNLVGANTLNWEVININGGTIGFSDAAITAGAINVNAGGRLNGSNNLVVTGNVSNSFGSTVVAGNATGTNVMRVNGNFINAGSLDMRSLAGVNASGDRLTITGNYTGVAGSTILLNTALGADASTTDRVIINGNVSGNSALVVTNVGGTGALTSGDGIKLVQVDGTSTAGAFSLSGGAVNVGAFSYILYNGGLSDPNDQDWYLRSRMRDSAATLASTARVSQDMGLATLGTLNERVGDRNPDQAGGVLSGMWGRAFGKDYTETAQSDTLGDSRSNGQFGGLQLGVDLFRSGSNGGGQFNVGLYGARVWSGTNDFITTPMASQAGQTRSNGWVVGGYATYQAPGWYLDGVVQGSWYDHRANANDGTSFSTESQSKLASIELGTSFGTSWKIEPQVQLIYSQTDVDSFTDSIGIASMIDVDDAVIGRAGFRVKRTWDYNPDNAGGRFSVYGKANVWSTLSGGQTAVNLGVSNPQMIEFKQSWADVGVGTTFSVGTGAEFFADADVEVGIDQPTTALSGRAGFRLTW